MSLGPVTAEIHTETTSHDDDRVVESLARGFLKNLAGVSANMHIQTTVKTDGIATSSVDECMISGSLVHDIESTGSAVSNVLSPCCPVSKSLNSYIPFFYLWHTKSAIIAGLEHDPPVHFFEFLTLKSILIVNFVFSDTLNRD